MAFNFCNSTFGTTVSSSSVSADGYEPQNLLTRGTFGQWKGFLAEHFIKPPVNITFTLPFNIDICSIVIDPKVSSQRSSGIEIFTATVPREKKDTSSTELSAGNKKQQDQSSTSDSSIVYNNIGKGYCYHEPARLVQFVNRRYRPVYKELSPPPSYEENKDVLIRDFRCGIPGNVKMVNQVVVRISRVHGGSVPALKMVQIWGQPTPSCGKPVIQSFLQKVRGLKMRTAKPSASKEAMIAKSKSESRGQVKDSSRDQTSPPQSRLKGDTARPSHQCPEEFLDPITCAIMAIPILLPSGHTIDQETLEKHNKTEAIWGRPPNDPFTGVPFSTVSKPIPNVKLKVRLDKFLLTGGDAFKSVPRTVNRLNEQACESASTSTVKPSILLQKKTTDSYKATHRDHSSCPKPQVKDGHLVKERPKKREYSESSRDMQGSSSKKPRTDHSRDAIQHETSKKVSHEQMVSDSLEDALASTLAFLPSYSKKPPVKPDTPDSKTCVNCSSPLGDSLATVYRMPCDHLMCRKCTTLRTDGIVCSLCNRNFKPSDISRVHNR